MAQTTTSTLLICAPVLGRPGSARPLLESLASNTENSWTLFFLCSRGDERQISAASLLAKEDSRVDFQAMTWPAGHGDWARKINWAFEHTHQPFLLLGADDLRFHPGWDVEALRVAEETGAGVIGTNDLGNPTVMKGKHSTHPLVAREYIREFGTVDEPGKVLHEGYGHQWVDTELCETAMSRSLWAFARDSHVEHLHFMWRKSERDATYDKALSTSDEDMALFVKRRALWVPDLRRAERLASIRR